MKVLSHARAMLLWQSRRSAASSSSAPAFGEALGGMWLQKEAPPRSMLEECAARAFKGLSVAQLRRLCKHIQIPMMDDSSLEAILRAALSFVSGTDTSDEELLLAMQQLAGEVDDDLCVFGLQDLQDAVDDHEWQEVEQFQGRKNASNPHSIEKSVARLRNDIAAKVANHERPAAKRHKKAQAGQGTILGGGRQYPTSQPTLFSEQEASAFLSPGWKCCKSERDNRWRVSHRLYGTRTRCWTAHGHETALKICLQFAWGFAEKAGTPCPFKWLSETSA